MWRNGACDNAGKAQLCCHEAQLAPAIRGVLVLAVAAVLASGGPDGRVRIAAFEDQDSARQRLMTEADALLIRPAGAPAAASGSEVGYIAL